MGAPHVWLKSAIEAAAAGVLAYPVEMTGGGEPPYVIYVREATSRDSETLDVVGVSPAARFAVTVYADSYVEAWQIAGSIYGDLHNFQGTAEGEVIESCLVLDERDGDAGYLEGREQPTFTVEQTIEVRFQE
jgi:hypothetical protein